MRIFVIISVMLLGYGVTTNLYAQEQSGLTFTQALNIDVLTPLSRSEILPMKARAKKINEMLED
ncbi:MAG TPA: hypothetical protein DCR37_07605, partial [Glaciecola sp.]|nr:hypothetical protein [Glaciecola sp.]